MINAIVFWHIFDNYLSLDYYKTINIKQGEIMATKKSQKSKLTTFGKIWRIALCIIVPLGGGFIISMFTQNAMGQFDSFNQPPLAPPAWLFPVAWTILYILMGVASWLIYLALKKAKKSNQKCARAALIIYGAQLVLNFIWTPIFFSAGQYWLAFVILMAMWLLEIVLIIKAFKLSRPAFWCLLPYLLWTTFAAYLNISIAILN